MRDLAKNYQSAAHTNGRATGRVFYKLCGILFNIVVNAQVRRMMRTRVFKGRYLIEGMRPHLREKKTKGRGVEDRKWCRQRIGMRNTFVESGNKRNAR